jgi:hypothetical protein
MFTLTSICFGFPSHIAGVNVHCLTKARASSLRSGRSEFWMTASYTRPFGRTVAWTIMSTSFPPFPVLGCGIDVPNGRLKVVQRCWISAPGGAESTFASPSASAFIDCEPCGWRPHVRRCYESHPRRRSERAESVSIATNHEFSRRNMRRARSRHLLLSPHIKQMIIP